MQYKLLKDLKEMTIIIEKKNKSHFHLTTYILLYAGIYSCCSSHKKIFFNKFDISNALNSNTIYKSLWANNIN